MSKQTVYFPHYIEGYESCSPISFEFSYSSSLLLLDPTPALDCKPDEYSNYVVNLASSVG